MSKGSIVLTAVLLLSAPSLALAQMDHSPMEKDAKCQCPMMKPAIPPMVVATSDGGVVVVTGRTMTKYDQDLDQTGSVELKACPLCAQMVKDDHPMASDAMKRNTEADVQASADALTGPIADVDVASATETQPIPEIPTYMETVTGDAQQEMIEIKPAGMVETAAEIKSEIGSLDVAATELVDEVKSVVSEGDSALDASADVLKGELDKAP